MGELEAKKNGKILEIVQNHVFFCHQFTQVSIFLKADFQRGGAIDMTDLKIDLYEEYQYKIKYVYSSGLRAPSLLTSWSLGIVLTQVGLLYDVYMALLRISGVPKTWPGGEQAEKKIGPKRSFSAKTQKKIFFLSKNSGSYGDFYIF